MDLQEAQTICCDTGGAETDKNFQDLRDELAEWHPAALGQLVEHAAAAAEEGFTAQGAAHPDLQRSLARYLKDE